MFHTLGSTTENNRIVSHREDRKETTEGQVSQSQGSTTEDNRKIANKEDRKQTAQGQVCLRDKVQQCNTTEWYRTEKIKNKTAKPIDVSEGQGSTTENIRKIGNREDRKETVTRPSISQARQAKDKTNISPREHGKKKKKVNYLTAKVPQLYT